MLDHSTFFSGEADSLCKHFEPTHTLFLMTHSSCCDVIKLRHIRPGGISRPGWKWRTQKLLISAKGEELKVWKGKGNQFYIIWYILNYHYLKVIINILYFTAPAELNQNIKYCKSHWTANICKTKRVRPEDYFNGKSSKFYIRWHI